MMYNLFYSSGGHGGPHHGLRAAKEFAHRFIRGHAGRTSCIELRPHTSTEVGGFGLMHKDSIYLHKDRRNEATK